MRKRSIGFLLWLDEDELNLVKKKAKKCGLSQQAYLRSLILNRPLKTLPPLELSAALRKLDMISNNMNQVAVKAHILNFIDAPLYQENSDQLQTVIAEIMRQIYQ